MTYSIFYHPKVISEDIQKLDRLWKKKIRNAIEGKLATSPELYGKPLRRSLSGYRKLRVGDYRVIFTIEKQKITILLIAHRSIVYSSHMRRD